MAVKLTNIANVKGWLGQTQPGDDGLLNRLIGSCSTSILSYLGRHAVFKQSYTEIIDGKDTTRIALNHWPVLSVSGLSVDGQAITASPTPYDGATAGYVIEPWDGYTPGAQAQFLSLRGYRFTMGYSNVSVSYVAGYAALNEAGTILAANAYKIEAQATYGTWMVDEGVTFSATGIALTKVTSAPTTGQYSVTDGIYQFAAADANLGVLISYSFTPNDLEQACIEMVAERYRYRSRIGEKSKSIGGQETISFDTSAMNEYTKMLLNPYKSILL